MNNEYCILRSKLLLPLLHKAADLIYRAGYSLPWKLNSNHLFYVSTQSWEAANTHLIFVPQCDKKCIMYIFYKNEKNLC